MKIMRNIVTTVAFVFTLYAVLYATAAYAHELPKGAKPLADSQKCAKCHQAIYSEWKGSMHANSSIHSDRAHAAVHKAFITDMEKAGKKGTYHCASCHMPMAANLKELIAGNASPNPKNPVEIEGTGCAFCHRIDKVIEDKDWNSYKLKSAETYGTANAATVGKVPHKTFGSKLFADGSLCLGCHGRLVNAHQIPVCSMKEEGQGNCVSCHMEKTEGAPAVGSTRKTHIGHSMFGGHDEDTLKKAVSLEATVTSDGEEKTLNITLKNEISHAFPSTMPLRLAFIKVVYYEASDKDSSRNSKNSPDNQCAGCVAGNAIWSNFKDSPMEDKNAVFMKSFKAGDKSGVPAWAAEAVDFDTRLKAGESRSLSYPIPKEGVSRIEVTLNYELFPPKAFDVLGIPKDGINDKVTVVARKEFLIGRR